MPENNQITPNKIKAFVPVTLDKERRLKLDINALINFEENTGKSWLSGVDTTVFEYKDWCILIWSMLLADDPGLTLNTVRKITNVKTMMRLLPDIEAAIRIAVDSGNEELPKETKPTAWLELWSFAKFNLHLTDAEFFGMTLAQFSALQKRYKDSEEWLNYRSAQICAVVANTVPRKSGGASYSIKNFMPNNMESNEMTDDEMFNMVKYINKKLGGTVEEV